MSYPEEKKRTGYVAAIVILGILALPVLLPLGLCVGGGLLVVGLCVAGGVFTAVLCIGGALLAAACCVFGALICVAGVLLAALVGIGFGIVLLFQAPASGMAVTGLSLLILGCALLCVPLAWEVLQLCIRGLRALAAWLGGLFRRFFLKSGKAKEGQETGSFAESVQKGAGNEE